MLGHWLDRERFLSGAQCTKRLWWSVRDSEHVDASSGERLRREERGRIRRAALGRWPDAARIDGVGFPGPEAIAATARTVADPAVTRIVGAAFVLEELSATADLLERRGEGWTLVRIADGPQIEPRDVLDLAYQVHVARACGVGVATAELLVLDRHSRHPHLADLFARRDLTARVEMLLSEVPGLARSRVNLLHGPIPGVEVGAHCREPWPCPYLARCAPAPVAGALSELHGAAHETLAELRGRGIRSLVELPLDDSSNAVWRRQREAAITGALVVEPGLARALRLFERPLAFVDVVAVRPAIPAWPGAHPWDDTPALFGSVFEHADGRRDERGIVIEADGDPWEALADAWIGTTAAARQIVVYGAAAFHRHLQDLQERAPHRATPLVGVRSRVLDLLSLVRDHVYHPGLRGDFGLDAVHRAILGAGDDAEDPRIAVAQWVGDRAELGPEERTFLRSALEETAILRAGRLAALMARLREMALSPTEGAGRGSGAARARRGWIDPAPRAPRITPPKEPS